MFRGSPKSFASDSKALSLARVSIAKGFDKEVGANNSMWFYLPFMHSEELSDQDLCVVYFTNRTAWVIYFIIVLQFTSI
jgi:uncharacterized protein (DUF924 family)